MNGFDALVIWAGIGGYIAFGIGAAIILLHAARRPVDERDERFAAVDDELSAAERSARRRVVSS